MFNFCSKAATDKVEQYVKRKKVLDSIDFPSESILSWLSNISSAAVGVTTNTRDS